MPGQDNARVIACELDGGDMGAQAKQWIWLRRGAAERSPPAARSGLGRVENEEGLKIRFRDEPRVEEELRALVAAESNCFSWARWEVRCADGDVILEITSAPEGAATLHAMFRPDPALGRSRACKLPGTDLISQAVRSHARYAL